MQSKASTVDAYINEIPEDRRDAINKLRKIIRINLPKGFEEDMGYGMIWFGVPHKLYPAGYHCNPKQPLPFLGLASQKNSINFYHMGIYADPALYDWFTKAYAKVATAKLDMGKSCIRFKKPEHIPYDLIGELCAKMTPADWIKKYESMLKK